MNKENDSKIQDFSSPEVLKRDSSVKSGFFKNILSKFSASDSYSYNNENTYKKYTKLLWQECRTKILTTAVTVAAVISICTIVNFFDWSLGFEVIVDGENIGLVTDRQMVYKAIDEVRGEVKQYFGADKKYEKNPVFVRRLVAEESLSDINDIKSALFANVDSMVEAWAIYIDGKAALGVASREAADWVFANYKKKYTGNEIAEDMSVDFCEKVEVKKEFLHIAMLDTPEEALKVLSGNNRELTTHTVKKGDTLWEIADRYDTTVEHILAINDDSLADNLREGALVNVEKAVPLLSVRTVQTVSLTEPVPFEVEEIKDGSMYEGKTVVAREGKDGATKVLARVTKVNGVQTNKDVIESETITQPVSKIIKVGIKERPPTTGSGTFINPTYGTLSSRYGSRWGRRHQGIDIAGDYNSDINAADGGIVTYSGWMSGYGNYVVIDHENGYQTAYGHCASLGVSVGDRVAKGDVIAKMGNTGRSTGTHLHFEVRKNGEYVNPLKYVGY